MAHTIWISTHAAAATIALISAVLALRSARFLAVHVLATAAMAVSLAPSLWLSRAANPVPLQVIFLGLLGLASVMSYRAVRAWVLRPRAGHPAAPRYVAAVGFNLIGLVTGFVTVGVLRLGWGTAAVVGAGVVIPVVGHHLLGRATAAARQGGASS